MLEALTTQETGAKADGNGKSKISISTTNDITPASSDTRKVDATMNK